MIKKDKVNEILYKQTLNIKDVEIPIPVNKEYENINKDIRVLAILCNTNNVYRYEQIRKDGSTLICDDIKYLNSINYLDNIDTIMIDILSFVDKKEIVYIIGMFVLLHRKVEVILIGKNVDIEIIRKDLSSFNNLYILDQEVILQDYQLKKIPLNSCNNSIANKKTKLNFLIYMKKIINYLIVIIVLISILVIGYLSFFIEEKETYNRNMNIQLDVGNSTILPITLTYKVKNDCFIEIEEIAENPNLILTIYNNDKQVIKSKIVKEECPDDKCDMHYRINFTQQKKTKYYILQIKNQSTITNVEIDADYFK